MTPNPQPRQPFIPPQSTPNLGVDNSAIVFLYSDQLNLGREQAYRQAKIRFRESIPDQVETVYDDRIGGRLARVLVQITPALNANGLDVDWTVEPVRNRDGIPTSTLKCTCFLTHIQGHREHSSHEVDIEAWRGDDTSHHHGELLMSVITYLKRVTLENVTGIATVWTGAELGSQDVPPIQPDTPKAGKVADDEINDVKTYWKENIPDQGDLLSWSKEEMRIAFYDWVQTTLEERIPNDSAWTQDQMDAIKDLISNQEA